MVDRPAFPPDQVRPLHCPLLVFAAVLAWQLSPAVAIGLIVALVAHEGAVGHDENILRPWQHIVILVLGPLPGLFVGMTMLAGWGDGESAWLHSAAMTAVVLDLFNLLPILPLDGGQIVDYALFAMAGALPGLQCARADRHRAAATGRETAVVCRNLHAATLVRRMAARPPKP